MYTDEELKKIINIGIERHVIVYDQYAEKDKFSVRLVSLMKTIMRRDKYHVGNLILYVNLLTPLTTILGVQIHHLPPELNEYVFKGISAVPGSRSQLAILVREDVDLEMLIPKDIVLGCY